jgi:hypothetical protein
MLTRERCVARLSMSNCSGALWIISLSDINDMIMIIN